MAKCCVQACHNSHKKKMSESPWLTFHSFPKDHNLRESWIKAVGRTNWQPGKATVVCCAHFKDDDFQDIKKGLRRRLKPGARPVVNPMYDLNLCARMRACRICLSLDRQMYRMKDTELEKIYTSMTGRPILEDEGRLPPQLCWECAARLTTAANFKHRAIVADKILNCFLDKNPILTYRDVVKMTCDHANVKTKIVIDRLSDSVDGEDSVAGIVKSDLSLPNDEIKTIQNFDLVEIKQENEIIFDSFDPNAVKTEIDLIPDDITTSSDITSNRDIISDFDITSNCDIASNFDITSSCDITSNFDITSNCGIASNFDITSSCDITSDFEITSNCDITSNSDITSYSDVMEQDGDSIDIKDLNHAEENNEIKENGLSKIFVNTEIPKKRKQVKPRNKKITPLVKRIYVRNGTRLLGPHSKEKISNNIAEPTNQIKAQNVILKYDIF